MPPVHMNSQKIDRNAPCWCGSGKKYKNCHEEFDEKLKSYALKGFIVPDRSLVKTPREIEGIRQSAGINRACLDAVADAIHAGMSTQEIDDIVYDTTLSMGGIPADLHYEGYPKSVCTSINEEVCHGIPDEKRILQDGDIINVDCSTILNGFFSDSSRSFLILSSIPSIFFLHSSSCIFILFQFQKFRFLIGCDQRIDDIIQRSVHDLVNVVKSQFDPVVCDP